MPLLSAGALWPQWRGARFVPISKDALTTLETLVIIKEKCKFLMVSNFPYKEPCGFVWEGCQGKEQNWEQKWTYQLSATF